MPCYHPILAYRSRTVNSSGKRSIVFSPNEGYVDMPVTIPCGQCIGCRLEYARNWAVRCMHEASLHDRNCFITLTFDDDHLDPNRSLVKSDFVNFMKRLRKVFAPSKIRFFHCGEYGDIEARPHHHALLFGVDMPDKVYHKGTGANKLYTSELLSKAWQYQGYCLVGSVTYESAAYVARYVTKKITGERASDYYGDRVPPYVTMSRRPGIARDWADMWLREVYPDDYVIIRNNIKCRPPRYYDKLYACDHPKEMLKVSNDRLSKVTSRSPSELVRREKITERRVNEKD